MNDHWKMGLRYFIAFSGHDLRLSDALTFSVKTEMINNRKNWYQIHKDAMTFGQKLADNVATGMGSISIHLT
jgi:hypothetical protein